MENAAPMSNLKMLPTELFAMVADYSSPADIATLRVVSRQCEYKIRRLYAERCFTNLPILLNSERSLREALKISQHPVFGGNVSTLTIHLDELPPYKSSARKQKQKQLLQDIHQGSAQQDDIHVPQRKLLSELLQSNLKTLTTIRLKSGSPPLTKMDWSSNKTKAYRALASRYLRPPKQDDRRAFSIVVGAMSDTLTHSPENYKISTFSLENSEHTNKAWSFPLRNISTLIATDTISSWRNLQPRLKSLELTLNITPAGQSIEVIDLFTAPRAFGRNMPELESLTLNIPRTGCTCLSDYPMRVILSQTQLPKLKVLKLRNAVLTDFGLERVLRQHFLTIERVVLERCFWGERGERDCGAVKGEMEGRYNVLEVLE
ncbi:uncharacterized protein MYCFIDRAFT_194878 [Pseudocercospora fijiensis CIRAD86]|uniref:F-box domain-containing protein n=1 Tax=Pseudocercospora fijiensis (strain CIRAD86) TaxID=383855 RepID=M2ZAV3_PSEFD|nr:uncharacterized protein MYCFIDRAFT_194878 [Pseudocercospora fijiensis CIRAD86]EME86970.1 hypothetical protein MYCFIDRAFT_194878 [Pseudocercospora fijiensis CIRAD86]